MSRVIMIQGTMSSAGKSFLAAGLCRIFKEDGLSVAPFKSQNMALNSFVTEQGEEMGRAQALQAVACGLPAAVRMNPVLLKPTSHVGSQVIVLGLEGRHSQPTAGQQAADGGGEQAFARVGAGALEHQGRHGGFGRDGCRSRIRRAKRGSHASFLTRMRGREQENLQALAASFI